MNGISWQWLPRLCQTVVISKRLFTKVRTNSSPNEHQYSQDQRSSIGSIDHRSTGFNALFFDNTFERNEEWFPRSLFKVEGCDKTIRLGIPCSERLKIPILFDELWNRGEIEYSAIYIATLGISTNQYGRDS